MPKVARAREDASGSKARGGRKAERSGPFAPSLEATLRQDVTAKRKRKDNQRKRVVDDDDNLEDIAVADADDLETLKKLQGLTVADFDDSAEASAAGIEPGMEEETVGFDDLATYPVDDQEVAQEVEAAVSSAAVPSAASSALPQRTIGALLFEHLQEQSRAQAETEKMALFSESTKKLFRDVGLYMSKYKSGKLPKALRTIPNLKNWLDILWLTRPESWSANGVAAVTPMFVSGSVNQVQCRKFMTHVLLPAVLKDLDANDGRLNVHLFNALCTCLLRQPAIFFKAVYFPVVLKEEDDCTYKEAVIMSAVVAKQSFPGIHAAAALIKMCRHQPQSNQLFYCMLRLIQKKHDLPVSAIKIVTKYFLSHTNYKPMNRGTDGVDGRAEIGDGQTVKSHVAGPKLSSMPVIWHQCLLVFIQHWKHSIDEEEREDFRALFKAHYHPKITPEARRELTRAASDRMGE